MATTTLTCVAEEDPKEAGRLRRPPQSLGNKINLTRKARHNPRRNPQKRLFLLGVCLVGGFYAYWFLISLSFTNNIHIASIEIQTSDSISEGGDHSYQIEMGEDSRPVILLGIFSVLDNNSSSDKRRSTHKADPQQRRDLIRSTYASHPQVCALNDFQLQQPNIRDPACRMLYTFVVGANPRAPSGVVNTSHPVLDPDSFSESHHDLTYLNIRENMNLGKTPNWFAYASSVARDLGIPYVAKTDDDTLIQVHSLLAYMDDNLPPRPHRLYLGREVSYCSKLADIPICEGISPYNWVTGEFYLLSWDLASYASSLVDRMKASVPEDIHMARLVYSHPQTIDRHFFQSKNQLWIHPLKDAESYKSTWNQIKDQELIPFIPTNNGDMTRKGDLSLKIPSL